MQESSTVSDADGSGGRGPPVSQEEIFATLSNRRRRLLIEYLRTTEGVATVRELSRAVAARENDVSVEQLAYKQRKRTYTALHQTHLPKLDSVGLVEYDADRGTVELTDRISEFDVYLDVVPEEEIPWHVYYLVVGLITAVVGLFVWVGLPPFDLLPAASYILIFAAVTILSACGHAYLVRE